MKRLALTVLSILLAAPAAADFDAESYPPYERCALCHDLFGVSRVAKFPHLAGQKQAYIEAQIAAFLTGARTNDGGQMAAIVTELKPEEIPVAAKWFAEQAPPTPSDLPTEDIGRILFENSTCQACHDNSANSSSDVPYLTSQHAGYLVKQMDDFVGGRRTHSTVAALHQELLDPMRDKVKAIAQYLASVSRVIP